MNKPINLTIEIHDCITEICLYSPLKCRSLIALIEWDCPHSANPCFWVHIQRLASRNKPTDSFYWSHKLYRFVSASLRVIESRFVSVATVLWVHKNSAGDLQKRKTPRSNSFPGWSQFRRWEEKMTTLMERTRWPWRWPLASSTHQGAIVVPYRPGHQLFSIVPI